ncbi:hypothetical protein EDB19DRAFT_1828564 [Suillus lakei]|nr:hypothetical protein EDB19DRAFT_1828564 [Suillus lakei]
MQLSFAGPAKRVIKMTGKAKAALEEKTIRTSSKRKNDGSGDSANTHLKKAKRNLLSGNTPTNSAGSTDEDKPVDKNRPVTASPSRHAVVRTEEEENLLNEDGGEKMEASDAEDGADETAEDELKRLMNDWNSPVYAFFDPTPQIIEIDGRRAHDFKCQAKRCKTKVRRYLDKGDARSTGNMRKHVRSCWGDEVLKAADQAKNANEVRQKIIGSFL